MSLKLPDWFENAQINKCDSWERQARLVISLVTNRIIILLKTPQKQAGSRAVTAAAFPDSHVSTPVSKQHPATASRQPHNDPGLLSQRGLRPCTPWWDYSHAKNYAVSELTAGKSLKCSYACWHSIANWWTSLNIYLCSTFRFCSSTSSWLLLLLCSFCLRHQPTVKHETQAPFPPTCPVPPPDPPRKTAHHLLKEENRITSSRHWHPRADRNFNSPFSKEIESSMPWHIQTLQHCGYPWHMWIK